MTEERDPEHRSDVPDLLEDWREAERDAGAARPGSAAGRLARKRADEAMREFHRAEDQERELDGNHRPRQHPDEPPA